MLPKSIGPEARTSFRLLIDVIAIPAIRFLRSNFKEPVLSTNNHLLSSLFRTMDALLSPYTQRNVDEDGELSESELNELQRKCEPLFYFSIVWSILSTVDRSGRLQFDVWLREQMRSLNCALLFPSDKLVYAYKLCASESGELQWTPWLETVEKYEYNPKLE